MLEKYVLQHVTEQEREHAREGVVLACGYCMGGLLALTFAHNTLDCLVHRGSVCCR